MVEELGAHLPSVASVDLVQKQSTIVEDLGIKHNPDFETSQEFEIVNITSELKFDPLCHPFFEFELPDKRDLIQTVTSRRNVVKAGLAVVGDLVFERSRSSQVDATENPLLRFPPPELSPKAAEWLNLSRTEQVKKTAETIDMFLSEKIPQASLEYLEALFQTRFKPEGNPYFDPPRFAKDIRAAIRGEEPFLYLVRLHDYDATTLKTGIVKNLSSEIGEGIPLAYDADYILLGIVDRILKTPKQGLIHMHVGFFGQDYFGERRIKHRIIGFIAEDPNIPSIPSSFVDVNDPNDKHNLSPYFHPEDGMPPQYHYLTLINRLLETRLSAIISGNSGIAVDIRKYNYPKIARERNLPEPLYDTQFLLDNAEYVERNFHLDMWDAIHGAAVSKTQPNLGIGYYANNGPVVVEITDPAFFPDALDYSTRPNVPEYDKFLTDRKYIKESELIQTPFLWVRRVATLDSLPPEYLIRGLTS